MADPSSSDFEWFQNHLVQLLADHRGEHALICERVIVGYYRSSLDAIKAGLSRYGEKNFTVELVDDSIEDLGFYSHVGSALQA